MSAFLHRRTGSGLLIVVAAAIPLLGTTEFAAAAPGCSAVDAPKSENVIRASSDCAAEVPRAAGLAATSLTPVTPSTTISSTPAAFATTNGDVLAITKISGAGTGSIAIGGNFTAVTPPGGSPVAARNFAIVNATTGAVLYAGNANSYVRAITSVNNTVYVGGDFTTFGGVSRSHAAALSPAGAVTTFNPAPSSRVRGLAADSTGVYMVGDFSSVRKVSTSTGSSVWSRSFTGGAGRAVLLSGGSLYVGGLFETYNGTTRHGLVKIDPTLGGVDTGFNANLRADTDVGTYGSYDGEEVLAMATAGTAGRLILGIGGHAPAGSASNEISEVSSASGTRIWRTSLIGDCQGVAAVGATAVGGYHRNSTNPNVPTNDFAAQFNDAGGSWTTWNPRVTGSVGGNADGGNGGVQAVYADPATRTLYLGGAFNRYNGTLSHQSVIAFTWS